MKRRLRCLARLALAAILLLLALLPASTSAGGPTAAPAQQEPTAPEPFYTLEPAAQPETAAPLPAEAAAEPQAVPVAPDARGGIVGRVWGAGNTPLGGAYVYAYRWSSELSEWRNITDTRTGSDGVYFLSLPVGTYRISFNAQHMGYFHQFWPNKPSLETAVSLVLPENTLIINVNARLIYQSRIVGRLVNAQGQPIRQQMIHLTPGSSFGYSGPDGVFAFEQLTSGTYQVYHGGGGPWLQQYYYGGEEYTDATPIVVPPETTVWLRDLVLVPEAVISGRVTDAAGQPGQNVTLFATRCDSAAPFEGAMPVDADASGVFRLGSLRAGTYFVSASMGFGAYPLTWYPNGLAPWQATVIQVPTGGTRTGINLRMTPYGSLRGSVTVDADIPLTEIQVVADPTSPFQAAPFERSAYVAADGTWTIRHLPPGEYRVYFSAINSVLEREYFSNAYTREDATPIVHGYPADTILPAARLGPMTSVVGKVTRSGGLPEPGVVVSLETPVSEVGIVYYARTDANGEYRFPAVEPGSYTLKFVPTQPGVDGQWWPGLPLSASPPRYVVQPGSGAVRADAALWPLGGPVPAPPVIPTPTPRPPTAGSSLNLNPEQTTAHTFPLPAGQTLQLTITTNAVRTPQTLTLAAAAPPTNLDPNYQPGPLAFALQAAPAAAGAQPDAAAPLALDRLATLALTYLDSDVAGLDESTLTLLIYNPVARRWEPTGAGVVERDPEHNRLLVQTRRLGTFALVDEQTDILLPAVERCGG